MTTSHDDTTEAMQETLELLKGFLDLYGCPAVAEDLGVSRSTLYRTVASGNLSPALKRTVWGWISNWFDDDPRLGVVEEEGEERYEGEVSGDLEVAARLGRIEVVLEELWGAIGRVGERLEQGAGERSGHGVPLGKEVRWIEEGVGVNRPSGPAALRTVVTLEPEPSEEYGGHKWTVRRWREGRARVKQLQKSSDRVARLEAEVDQMALEVQMSEETGLTLPPAVRPWQVGERRDQLDWRRKALLRLRREKASAVRWRRLRRVMSGGLWKW